MRQASSSIELAGLLGGSAQQPKMKDFLITWNIPFTIPCCCCCRVYKPQRQQGCTSRFLTIVRLSNSHRKWTVTAQTWGNHFRKQLIGFGAGHNTQAPCEHSGNYLGLKRVSSIGHLWRGCRLNTFIESAAAVKGQISTRNQIRNTVDNTFSTFSFPALRRNLLFCS